MSSYRIIEFAELESTNRYACARLDELSDGDVIQAMVQTAGHGRLRRPWLAHVPGNLCLSLVLKPVHAAPAELPLTNLSQLLALCVCRALAAHGVQANLKWPNDVLVAGHKIAGLLAETVVQGNHGFRGMVLGLGVNLNLDAQVLATIDQPATSLALVTCMPVNVAAFRDAVLQDFFIAYDEFLACGFSMIHDEYLARCAFLGTHVAIHQGNETIRGLASNVTLGGTLEIVSASGEIRQVDLGEML